MVSNNPNQAKIEGADIRTGPVMHGAVMQHALGCIKEACEWLRDKIQEDTGLSAKEASNIVTQALCMEAWASNEQEMFSGTMGKGKRQPDGSFELELINFLFWPADEDASELFGIMSNGEIQKAAKEEIEKHAPGS